MTDSPARRRAILAVLVLVTVACLASVTLVVATRGAGDGVGERLRSLKNDEVPESDRAEDREEVLALAREFASRFNTYGPEMLDEQGQMPDYAAVQDLMTSKMGTAFEKYRGLVETTVAQWDAASACEVYVAGVASQDEDSAEVLVAGTIQTSLSYSRNQDGSPGPGGGAEDDDEIRVTDDPKDFRYQVTLVKIDGAWLVDDFDDVDDGLPQFSEPGIPEESPLPEPSAPATSAPQDDPTSEQTGEGDR
ncbi:hypothetical protein [Nocardioides antri]|uniref:Mce-associated membrane protein n=1 Tax=Nocardioides antri TaxID=2607659 RepID=A0A5B1M702_9ACTN|nr:hypothetical protein [Nocardioides antri]KAA1428434.1 hypothetical protein F0U47_05820 [Nocardioides antri]